LVLNFARPQEEWAYQNVFCEYFWRLRHPLIKNILNFFLCHRRYWADFLTPL
jgi:hypothetical protein